ncbi:PREDICTED: uncharacterized protein LOC108971678 isoform X2 [Bactrocera latifrons]|uniref:uncharacterized protein LOC108971678 isoform X2 n=1 Tax=Bactrocera latifrons TaxID=174628 RepID=UPI0008DE81B5|nr:PREDICTED: uncharacterized protein LOC108971678 isoform X2 [Bactrocera latifrons]
MPHNMYVCMRHANFSFLLMGCATVIECFSEGFETFLKLVCCNIENENCTTNDCEKCKKDVKDIVPLKHLSKMDANVKWQYWRKLGDRVVLTYTVAALSHLLHELQVQLPIFKQHFIVKVVCQNEIQSAHFNYRN